MKQKEYDVVVLGGNLAGVKAALATADNGLKTAIVEENQIGGSLYQTSEHPLELLAANNEFIKECANYRENGINFSDISFDPNTFFDKVQKDADKLSEELVGKLKDEGIDIYLGQGLARPDKTIAIIREEAIPRVISFKNLIYTGEPVSTIPPMIRSNFSKYFTGNNIGLLDYIPNGLIIYGSGQKAISVADIWSSLGCQVYLISPNERILPEIPEAIEEKVLDSLKEKKVRIYPNSDLLDLYQDSEYDYHFEIIDNETNDQTRIIGQELVILDREGASINGIESLDPAQENGWITTDNKLMTSIDGFYTWTGSNQFERSEEVDSKAAEYLGKLISGKIDREFEKPKELTILNYHPGYIRFGDITENDDVIKGSFKDNDEFLDLYISKELGEIVGAEIFHNEAEELLKQIEFLTDLEISVNDLLDLKQIKGLNDIIVKAIQNTQ